MSWGGATVFIQQKVTEAEAFELGDAPIAEKWERQAAAAAAAPRPASTVRRAFEGGADAAPLPPPPLPSRPKPALGKEK